MILDKSQYQYKNESLHELYNVGKLLEECEKRKLFYDSMIQLIASRRETNKNLNHKFITTLHQHHSKQVEIEIFIKSPKDPNGLELVDAISYALYQKYEMNNLEL